jgi:hypothetical protein
LPPCTTHPDPRPTEPAATNHSTRLQRQPPAQAGCRDAANDIGLATTAVPRRRQPHRPHNDGCAATRRSHRPRDDGRAATPNHTSPIRPGSHPSPSSSGRRRSPRSGWVGASRCGRDEGADGEAGVGSTWWGVG